MLLCRDGDGAYSLELALLAQEALFPEFGDSLGELVNCRRRIPIWSTLPHLPFHESLRSSHGLFVVWLNSIVRHFLDEILQVFANGLLDRTVRLLRMLLLEMQQDPEFETRI